jgi:hypothetical protein
MHVQALIADDRALMARLSAGERFAQEERRAGAERAQRLGQESNAAHKKYQRQVRTLEEHLERANGLYVYLPDFFLSCFLSIFFCGG